MKQRFEKYDFDVLLLEGSYVSDPNVRRAVIKDGNDRCSVSCGGHAPTAERTMSARIFTESLTPRPELENSQGQSRQGGASCRSGHVRNAPLAMSARKRRPVVNGMDRPRSRPRFPPRSASRKEEMEKRSRQRVRDQVAHMAFVAES
jgi:hypothetical protein